MTTVLETSPLAPVAAVPGSFRPPITAIRWGTVAVGAALAGASAEPLSGRLVTGFLVLVAYATYRTARPLVLGDGVASTLRVLVEVGVSVAVVDATGYWQSPFVFSLTIAILIAGFASGLALALRISILSALAVALPFHLTTDLPITDALHLSAQFGVQLVLVGMIAEYARRFSGEADARRTVALDRLGRLSEANTLLYSLHRLAQTLPASLDLDEVLDSTTARLRSFLDITALAIVVPDDSADGFWVVRRQEGVRLPALLTTDELPAAVRAATQAETTISHPSLDAEGFPGLSVRSRSGLYGPLRARNQLIGVIAIEHDASHHFTPADVSLLDGMTETAALAIDNARWFSRLQTVGAAEERTRIARELHDRIGQSIAYLGFELDRIIDKVDDPVLGSDLDHLRRDVRAVVSEIRETLYDLRTDVSDSDGFVEVLEAFLDRVRQRSAAQVTFRHEDTARLPLPQERELWRIAQEAVNNAERHASATDVSVSWRTDGQQAVLEVIDNGRGFETGKAGRLDSYGIVGMRERAASIGASLAIDSAPGRGTRVRCILEPS